MNYKMMGRISALILVIEAVFMVPALLISLALREKNAAAALFISILVILCTALILYILTRGKVSAFRAKDGMISVGFSWLLLSIMGALPFKISGEIPRYIDAFFETVSGFTTTGASILVDVEAMSKGLLYWRSFTHWLGGMGVLVFMLAIVPLSGRNDGFTVHLLRAESPGPNVGKLKPRMRDTAFVLYEIYIALTVLNVIFLLAGGMTFFEAICTAFGTAGTGGFGVRGDSIASYSPYLQNVCTVFMLLFGVNFSCYYLVLHKHFREVFHDEELLVYFALVLGAIGLIVLNVKDSFASLGEAVHHTAFTVASIITTTGFATVDFNAWPTFSKAIILFLMFAGACAGSTGGGIKVSRVILIFKSVRRNIHQVQNPLRVEKVRVNGQVMHEKVIMNTICYLSAYVLIVIVSFLLLSVDSGFSVESTFSSVMCCFNNIGPGFDQVGPTSNFFAYSDMSKIILSIDMLLGRLEIFPILLFASRSTWKKL